MYVCVSVCVRVRERERKKRQTVRHLDIMAHRQTNRQIQKGRDRKDKKT